MANLHITPKPAFIVPNCARVGGRQTDRGGKKGKSEKKGERGEERRKREKERRDEKEKKAKRADMLFFMFQGVPYLKTNLTSALRNYY